MTAKKARKVSKAKRVKKGLVSTLKNGLKAFIEKVRSFSIL